MKILEAIIEIPKDSHYKYEVDKNTGELMLDRVVNLKIPYNYGFIPNTLCEDGDPLDVFVVSTRAIPPKTRVKVKVFGILLCRDNGDFDHKLIGFLDGEEPAMFRSLVEKSTRVRIENYLTNYKSGFEILAFHDKEVASTKVRQYQHD